MPISANSTWNATIRTVLSIHTLKIHCGNVKFKGHLLFGRHIAGVRTENSCTRFSSKDLETGFLMEKMQADKGETTNPSHPFVTTVF